MKKISDIRSILQNKINNNVAPNIIESGVIKDNNGNDFQYEILEGWDIINAKLCDENWGTYNLNILDYIVANFESEDEQNKQVNSSQLEDMHWSWFNKHHHYYDNQYNWCFLLVDGIPQGACLIYHPKISIDNQSNIFYVEYVASAPWNRPNLIAPPRFRGIGTKLLKSISKYSLDNHKLTQGFSLLALPKAEGYYQKIGMNHFNVRDEGSMKYFEMFSNEHQVFMEGA
jgi:hypothetical protein